MNTLSSSIEGTLHTGPEDQLLLFLESHLLCVRSQMLHTISLFIKLVLREEIEIQR